MFELESLINKLNNYNNVKGTVGLDASVCVLFNDKLELILEKRVKNEKDPWSGQVSFPGGHFESSDIYIINTAIRELKEETGIEGVKVLGGLDIHHPRNMPKLNVYPFVCYINEFKNLKPQKSEIEYLFTPNIKDLKMESGILNINNEKINERYFIYKNDIIWGMTARIIENLLKLFQEH